MSAQQYLPSRQFVVLLGALCVSVGLVYAAQLVTQPASLQKTVVVGNERQQDWRSSLGTIQAQSGVQIPSAPDESVTEALRTAAQTQNKTETIARTLLVNLGEARAQGLGSDIPTQDKIIAAAIEQARGEKPTPTYTLGQLKTVESTKESQRSYANALATVVTTHQHNQFLNTMVLIDIISSKQEPADVEKLKPIKAQYQAIVDALLKTPVPQTLAPFHLQLVNNFARIAKSYDAMALVLTDPVQGLSGIQTYQTLTNETVRVFINIAQAFTKGGILFTKDEPGASWAALLSAQ